MLHKGFPLLGFVAVANWCNFPGGTLCRLDVKRGGGGLADQDQVFPLLAQFELDPVHSWVGSFNLRSGTMPFDMEGRHLKPVESRIELGWGSAGAEWDGGSRLFDISHLYDLPTDQDMGGRFQPFNLEGGASKVVGESAAPPSPSYKVPVAPRLIDRLPTPTNVVMPSMPSPTQASAHLSQLMPSRSNVHSLPAHYPTPTQPAHLASETRAVKWDEGSGFASYGSKEARIVASEL
ncbi:hypothetical protein IE53DRAFT_390123 [Violaceomyces palustris]|uniref:Uncharacterized protein n=1 Tax=Violaceomyces palustris TaxID=1673888 RepID=A0ACD0NPG1_9BASI|nr:hypothetical protein IE53DRAFT_390123 [Violaceomyces palustris]